MAREYERLRRAGSRISCTLDLPPQRFDGIFANASLFHVPTSELPRVLGELHAALKPRGVLFASNPHGDDEEGWNRGRYGAYHEPATWSRLRGGRGIRAARPLLPAGGLAARRAAVARDGLAQNRLRGAARAPRRRATSIRAVWRRVPAPAIRRPRGRVSSASSLPSCVSFPVPSGVSETRNWAWPSGRPR